MTKSGKIRAGMGGWTFEPWDSSFYPDKLSKAKQLHYASRQVPTIEVNGTYYSTFTPATFAKWAGEAPDGFIFSLKAIRFATNRRVLAEAGESVERFLGSGVSELGDKLGPILWQFAPTKKFDADDFGGIPEAAAGKAGRREAAPCGGGSERLVRRARIRRPAAQAQRRGRLCRPRKLSRYRRCHRRLRLCAAADRRGRQSRPATSPRRSTNGQAGQKSGRKAAPDDLPRADPSSDAQVKPRDVFVYFITSGKVRAPHGAMAFMERVKS